GGRANHHAHAPPPRDRAHPLPPPPTKKKPPPARGGPRNNPRHIQQGQRLWDSLLVCPSAFREKRGAGLDPERESMMARPSSAPTLQDRETRNSRQRVRHHQGRKWRP